MVHGIAYGDEDIDLLVGAQVAEFGLATQEFFETEDGQVVKTLGGAWVKFHTSFRNRLLRELKGSRLAVFLCIGLRINDRGESYPSIDLIAKETGYSTREVKHAIQELEAVGMVTVVRSHRRVNLYTVTQMLAYGAGNDPLGEVSAPKRNPASKCTQNMHQTARQEEPRKGEPDHSAAGGEIAARTVDNELTPGQKHLLLEASMSVPTHKRNPNYRVSFTNEEKLIVADWETERGYEFIVAQTQYWRQQGKCGRGLIKAVTLSFDSAPNNPIIRSASSGSTTPEPIRITDGRF